MRFSSGILLNFVTTSERDYQQIGVRSEFEDEVASLASSRKKQAMPIGMPDHRLPKFQNDTHTVQAAYHSDGKSS
jgi:hypothetical protein